MSKIDQENIESYILDKIEGNLSLQDEKDLEVFLNANPHYRELMSQYDKDLKLPEDDVVFEEKQSLKRKPLLPLYKKMFYFSSSAAAVLLLLLLLRHSPATEIGPKTTNETLASSVAKTENPQSEETETIAASNVEKQENPTRKADNKKNTPAFGKKTSKETPSSLKTDKTTKPSSLDNLVQPVQNSIQEQLIAENNQSVKHDTVYIIYAGTKPQNNMDRFVNNIEKHTNIDITPAVSYIKNTAGKVKQKKDKLFKI